MKSTSALLLAAVLLGTLSVGVTAYLVLDRDQAEAREALPASLELPASSPRDEFFVLAEEVDALAEENRALRQRLQELEMRPKPVARAPVEGFVSQAEFDAFVEEMRVSLRQPVPPPAEPEELKEQVADLLIDLRREEAITKIRGYQEKRTARLEQDIGKLTDWLELSPYQADEMRGVLTAQYEREEEVRLMWEDGAEDEVLGERKAADGETFRADLEQVLTPEQLDSFWTAISGRGGK